MSLASDLRDQAWFLAMKERRKPKQASLKRAISTAYYALFHLLLDDGMRLIAPSKPDGLRTIVRRAFSHSDMLAMCRAVQNNGWQAKLMSKPIAREMLIVTKAFEDLQEARHSADYDPAKVFKRVVALSYLETLDQAFLAWSATRASPDAQIFLFAMFLGKRWGRV